MSCIIRAVKGAWTPMPSAKSLDVKIQMPTDTYGLAQMAIEASERLHQTQVNRTIRAGRAASPLPSLAVRPLPTPASSFVLNMPIR